MKVLVFILVQFFIIISNSISYATNLDDVRNYEIEARMLDRYEFSDFITSPSVTTLRNSAEFGKFIVLNEDKTSDKEYFSIGETYNGEISRIGRGTTILGIPLYYQLFQLYNDRNYLESFLNDSGINTNILDLQMYYISIYDRIFYNNFKIPPSLYVITSSGNYIITLNSKLQNILYSPRLNYDLELYTEASYMSKYGIYNGNFIINDKLIQNDLLKIININAYIPLRGVMEALGYNVAWDNSTRDIKIYNEQNSITLSLGGKYEMHINNYNQISSLYYFIENNRTLIYLDELKEIFSALSINMKVELNIDQHCLTINSY